MKERKEKRVSGRYEGAPPIVVELSDDCVAFEEDEGSRAAVVELAEVDDAEDWAPVSASLSSAQSTAMSPTVALRRASLTSLRPGLSVPEPLTPGEPADGSLVTAMLVPMGATALALEVDPSAVSGSVPLVARAEDEVLLAEDVVGGLEPVPP
jgi:hypothetical protein